MAKVLLGLSGCYDAFVAAPAARALIADGHALHVAWFGARERFEDALALGLPDCDATIAGDHDGHALVAAAEFADDDWLDCDTALTVGDDPFAVAVAQAMVARDRLVVRLQAGDRWQLARRDHPRRLADHAANAFCVRTERQRLQLRREGIDDDRIAVVGSLAQAAAAQLRPARLAERVLWLAVEHARTAQEHGAALGAAARAVAATHGLTVRAVPKVLATADWTAPDWFVEELATPTGQLRAACGAALVLTDSFGHQELAAALGVPCVQLGDRGVADVEAEATRLLARAAGGDAPAAAACDDRAAARVVAALRAWREPTSATAALPSDADASGRTFDAHEALLVDDVLHRGTLNSTRGAYVARFEQEFAAWLGSRHAVACASGSAAVHCAVAALGLAAGDEVITTPITDMGALTPIFYEGCVPVFADVDPATLNVTAATIEAQLTERTKAIVVTHLFGRPCDMGPILELACARGLPVIEDAAQAFGASLGGRKAGRHGLISAFSLQQGKHITTGEGGIVCTDDDELRRRVFLCVNKAWGYGDQQPDHYFPALNYRMTELQGAVACGQLPKLDGVVADRRHVAALLRDGLRGLAGVRCPDDPADGEHSYWKFAFRVDDDVVPGGAVALGARMRAQGIACAPRYVQKPAFECQVFRDWRAHPVSSLPLQHNPRGATTGPLFDRARYPGAIRGLEQVVVLPINENYRRAHADHVIAAITTAHRELRGG